MDLLSEVKNYLDITWNDEGTDNKVYALIKSAKSYLNRKAGVEIVYESDNDDLLDEDAVMLLKDYIRYARSNALDEFEKNYTHEIISLRDKYLGERNGIL